jgi:hypothetical protein
MNNDPLSPEAQSRAVATGVFKGLFAFFILLPLGAGAVWLVLTSVFDVGNGGEEHGDPQALGAKYAALLAKQQDQKAEQAKAQADAKARQDAADAAAREEAAQNLWTLRQWALKDGSVFLGTLSSIGPEKVLILAETPPRSRVVWRTNLVESDQQLVSIAAAKQEK